VRILIVEDDHKIANAVAKGLVRQSFAVDCVYDGDEGLAMAINNTYDLLVLDRMLPGEVDGIGILKAVRQRGDHVPILLLTAKDHVLDRAEGLNAGADDYLVKPFAFVELIARVRALLRRPTKSLERILSYDDLTLDTNTMRVTRSGKHIELTSLEFALLEYLMRNANQVVSKENIIQSVWNYDADVLPNTVEVYIGYLRNKIDKPFPTELIYTKRGFGYVFGDK
jgi:DNA-binding response OmpR family regulator